jgi:hypothetical protein
MMQTPKPLNQNQGVDGNPCSGVEQTHLHGALAPADEHFLQLSADFEDLPGVKFYS